MAESVRANRVQNMDRVHIHGKRCIVTCVFHARDKRTIIQGKAEDGSVHTASFGNNSTTTRWS